MKLSDRVINIEESQTVGLASVIHELKSRGEKIIGLNVGEPDFHTPENIKQATIKALEENQTKYSLVPGLTSLREAIAKKLHQENAIDCGVENILISHGSKQILYNIFQTIINPGDEVIVLRPYWVTFPESIKLAGGVPVFVETDNHQMNLNLIEQAITNKTKAIIINSPNNPTGAVYPEEDLRTLMNLIIQKNLWFISDEAYERLTYGKAKHVSPASFSQEAFRHTITVQTLSKSHCMTGFRIGYMCAEKNLIKAVNKLQSHLTGNNSPFSQQGAVEALLMDQSFVADMIKVYEKRRDLSYEMFSELFTCPKPDGAFYLFFDVSRHLNSKRANCNELAQYLLQEAKVALVPGIAFGQENYMRLSFATSEEELIQAYEQIKKVL